MIGSGVNWETNNKLKKKLKESGPIMRTSRGWYFIYDFASKVYSECTAVLTLGKIHEFNGNFC